MTQLIKSKTRTFDPSYHLRTQKKSFFLENISQKTIDIEIGCGVGWHTIKRAIEHPQHYVIGIEKTQERYSKFYQRYLSHKAPKNLKPVNAHAVTWITQNFSKEKSIDNIFLLYPNPYPKSSDRKKRWCNTPFIKYLIDLLKDNGCFYMASNEKFYALEFRESLEGYGMQLKSQRILNKENLLQSYKPRTHFEKKYLLENQECYDYIFTKHNSKSSI